MPELAERALWFTSVNRNKRSITLDYFLQDGRELLYDLVRRSDVMITNQLPSGAGKAGRQLRALNERSR